MTQRTLFAACSIAPINDFFIQLSSLILNLFALVNRYALSTYQNLPGAFNFNLEELLFDLLKS